MNKSHHHADIAFDMSIKADNDVWYAQSLLLQAMYSIRTFSLEDARIQLDAIERIYTSINRRHELAKPFLLKAYIAEHQNDIATARKYMKSALNLARYSADSIALIPYKKYQADFYNRRGDFIEAFTRYKELSYFEQQHKLDFSRAESLVGIASVYLSLGDCDKAAKSIDEAILQAMSSGNIITRGKALKYRGNCHVKRGEFREAEKAYNKALEIFLSKDAQLEAGRVYNNLGVIALEKNNFTLASDYMKKALDIYDEYPFHYSKAKTIRNLGRLHFKKGNKNEGIRYLNESIELAKQGNYTETLLKNYHTLITFYISQNNYDKAIAYYHKMQDLEREDITSLYTRLKKIQERYDRSRKLKEYQLKNAQYRNEQLATRKNNTIRWLIAGIAALLIILGVLIYFFRKARHSSGSPQGQRHNFLADHNEGDIKKARYTFNTIGDGVVWVNEDGIILYLNQMAKTYSKQDTPHQIDHLIESLTPGRWQEIWSRLKNEHPYLVEEHTIVSGNKTIPVEVSLNMLSHQHNFFVSMIIKDITIRKQNEESLRQAKERAEESDRLKTRFIANMSHEIRTPVNTIGGFATELNNEKNPAERARYIEMIKKSADRLINLVDDLIDISKLEAENLKVEVVPVDLHELLRTLIEKYRHKIQQAGKPLIIIDDFPLNDKHVTVYADRKRYKQVLDKLLNNAVKFTPKGEITVGYRFLGQEKVEVYVKDTGIGIKEAYHSDIFALFSQADISDTRKFQGSGLGLSISKKLMTLMRGSLTYESEEGKGSTFKTIISGHAGIKANKPGTPLAIDGLNILLLSDTSTSMNNAFLKAILKKAGAQITTRDSLKGALANIPAIKPGIILINQSMLQHSELKLCEAIKKQKPDVKIVLLADNHKTYGGQYDGIIESHYNREEVLRTIAEVYSASGQA
ncbi:MAG: tetratricopeptide repeat protein [Bacteroidales bacterium]|nr:tetratricopeptide repeat protein [Bacteroidales bacterium]